VLGPRAVGDVTRAELAQGGDDCVEVSEGLPEQNECGEKHGLLLLHVLREERPDCRRGGEEARVERVHELVAPFGDQVEAGFESFQVE
jgi:hypothetical protein